MRRQCAWCALSVAVPCVRAVEKSSRFIVLGFGFNQAQEVRLARAPNELFTYLINFDDK
jgi:hypothetical protein